MKKAEFIDMMLEVAERHGFKDKFMRHDGYMSGKVTYFVELCFLNQVPHDEVAEIRSFIQAWWDGVTFER